MQINDPDFHISNPLFIVIISSSLPSSWDTFTEPYVGGKRGLDQNDPWSTMGSQEFIGILKEHYTHLVARAKQGESVSQAIKSKCTLSSRMQTSTGTTGTSGSSMYCNQCGCRNHNTKDCRYLKKTKCNECGKEGHLKKDCWGLKAKQNKHSNKEKPGRGEKPSKKPKNEQAHPTIEEVAFKAKEEAEKDEDMYVSNVSLIDLIEDGLTFDDDKVSLVDSNDEHILYYDWLTDCAITSYVSNQ